MSPIRGYVFDAYGTLFDVHSVVEAGRAIAADPAGRIGNLASNGWDVAGAKTLGYRVAWCNRVDAPEEELGVRADVVVRTLDQLPR